MQHPGAFIREMERELEMPPGLISYHLQQLERSGLVRSHDDGYRKAYFQSSGFQPSNRKTISLMRQKSPNRIIFILLGGEQSFQTIQTKMELSKSTLSHHLKKLTGSGLIVTEKKGRELYYRINNPEQLINVLVSMKSDFDQDAVKNFAEIWSKLGRF